MALDMVCVGNNVYDVGSFDAKTYFAELLRKVQSGVVVNITKNGKQVAVLQGKQSLRNERAFAAHQRILNRAEKFRQLREENSEEISADELKELKNAGRKN